MNYSDTKKIVVGGFLILIVVVAVVFTVISSKKLLTITQPQTSSDLAQSNSQPVITEGTGQVLGESIANPIKDIYINPFAE